MRTAGIITVTVVLVFTTGEAWWRVNRWPERDPGWFDTGRLFATVALALCVLWSIT